jgi:superfamily II DNA or RNA helicase
VAELNAARRILGRRLTELSPASFGRLVERFLWHLGFHDVSNIDGPFDEGADIVAARGDNRWVCQCKWKRSGNVDVDAVEELRRGLQAYEGNRGAVVTTTGFTANAQERVATLAHVTNLNLGLWGSHELHALAADPQTLDRFSTPELRPYQVDAFQAARHDLRKNRAAFLVLATGLGKTVIAGTVIDWFLSERPDAKVLVLAHTRDLVNQLERALWRHLSASVPTQQIHSQERPEDLTGVTVATIQSAIAYIRSGFRPDFIFIDEAHHTGEAGLFAEVLSLCPDSYRLGATATPWRGDEFDISNFFGQPSCKIGIEEGMRLGYLVDVHYRLFVDNIDWDVVSALSDQSYSIKELNHKLFMPQRDERIRDELLTAWHETRQPRAIVFCQTIEHAERMIQILKRVPQWRHASTLHNQMLRREQTTVLTKFRLGDIPLLVAVDVLNEGVDVPDVNIVCFARVTHSRRIFIQQLGRGLRLSVGKTHVTVLDFVSDVRRVAAAINLRRQFSGESEELLLPSAHSITFNDSKAESIMEEWIKDAASLETAADDVKLNFPPTV